MSVRSKALALAMGALLVAITATTALAGHQSSGVKSYTGCLVPKDGVIIKIKEGESPASPCTGGSTLAHFSGGDITKISVGSGLTTVPSPGENGDVRIELAAGQALPQNCDDGRVAEWDTSQDPDGWVCGIDDNTTYTAGTGLELTGSNDTTLEIQQAYRLPGKTCGSGEFATGFSSPGGAIQCAPPAASTPPPAYTAHTSSFTIAGENNVVLSLDPPNGKYLLLASVDLQNKDNDSASGGSCTIPGFAGSTYVLAASEEESLSMSSVVTYSGGSIALLCGEGPANVDVGEASLVAVRVS